jgi:hypothetical protein
MLKVAMWMRSRCDMHSLARLQLVLARSIIQLAAPSAQAASGAASPLQLGILRFAAAVAGPASSLGVLAADLLGRSAVTLPSRDLALLEPAACCA